MKCQDCLGPGPFDSEMMLIFAEPVCLTCAEHRRETMREANNARKVKRTSKS